MWIVNGQIYLMYNNIKTNMVIIITVSRRGWTEGERGEREGDINK